MRVLDLTPGRDISSFSKSVFPQYSPFPYERLLFMFSFFVVSFFECAAPPSTYIFYDPQERAGVPHYLDLICASSASNSL